MQEAFSDNTEELINIMKSPKPVKMQFADSISLGTTKTTIKEPWRSGFKAFGEIPEVQALQLELADKDYGQLAIDTRTNSGSRTSWAARLPSTSTCRMVGSRQALGKKSRWL